MSNTQPPEKAETLEEVKHTGQRLEAVILKQVMHQLGQPDGRVRAQVRKLWEDRYRVNIYMEPETGSAIIAHSYFIVTDDNGAIVAATPRITKKY